MNFLRFLNRFIASRLGRQRVPLANLARHLQKYVGSIPFGDTLYDAFRQKEHLRLHTFLTEVALGASDLEHVRAIALVATLFEDVLPSAFFVQLHKLFGRIGPPASDVVAVQDSERDTVVFLSLASPLREKRGLPLLKHCRDALRAINSARDLASFERWRNLIQLHTAFEKAIAEGFHPEEVRCIRVLVKGFPEFPASFFDQLESFLSLALPEQPADEKPPNLHSDEASSVSASIVAKSKQLLGACERLLLWSGGERRFFGSYYSVKRVDELRILLRESPIDWEKIEEVWGLVAYDREGFFVYPAGGFEESDFISELRLALNHALSSTHRGANIESLGELRGARTREEHEKNLKILSDSCEAVRNFFKFFYPPSDFYLALQERLTELITVLRTPQPLRSQRLVGIAAGLEEVSVNPCLSPSKQRFFSRFLVGLRQGAKDEFKYCSPASSLELCWKMAEPRGARVRKEHERNLTILSKKCENIRDAIGYSYPPSNVYLAFQQIFSELLQILQTKPLCYAKLSEIRGRLQDPAVNPFFEFQREFFVHFLKWLKQCAADDYKYCSSAVSRADNPLELSFSDASDIEDSDDEAATASRKTHVPQKKPLQAVFSGTEGSAFDAASSSTFFSGGVSSSPQPLPLAVAGSSIFGVASSSASVGMGAASSSSSGPFIFGGAPSSRSLLPSDSVFAQVLPPPPQVLSGLGAVPPGAETPEKRPG